MCRIPPGPFEGTIEPSWDQGLPQRFLDARLARNSVIWVAHLTGDVEGLHLLFEDQAEDRAVGRVSLRFALHRRLVLLRIMEERRWIVRGGMFDRRIALDFG